MSISSTERGGALEKFLAGAGWEKAQHFPLPGDASTRRYIRLRRGDEQAMLMDQPQQSEAPIAGAAATPGERRALGYNAQARLAGADCARFAALAKHLRARGLAAPEIHAADLAQGFLLLEDLGTDLFTDALAKGAAETELYEAAIDVLVRLHEEPAPLTIGPLTIGTKTPLFRYDETAYLAEIDLVTEWFFPAALGRAPDNAEIEEHRALWRNALRLLEGSAPVLVHRDYHAQNLIWRADKAGLGRIGVIDFQDALAGSPAYDLVSLLEDARRDVDPVFARAMIVRYLENRPGLDADLDSGQFGVEAALLAAQRNAKIVGIFARLAMRDRKPNYLAHLPRVWRYLERDLAHPALAALKSWYDHAIPRELRGIPKSLAAGDHI